MHSRSEKGQDVNTRSFLESASAVSHQRAGVLRCRRKAGAIRGAQSLRRLAAGVRLEALRFDPLLRAGVLLTGLALAACGGGDSSAPATSAPTAASTSPASTTANPGPATATPTAGTTSVATSTAGTTSVATSTVGATSVVTATPAGTEITLTAKLAGVYKVGGRTECAPDGGLISFKFAIGVDIIGFAIKGAKTGEKYVFPQSPGGAGPVTVLLVQMEKPDYLAGFQGAAGKGTIDVGTGGGSIDLDLHSSEGDSHISGRWRCN